MANTRGILNMRWSYNNVEKDPKIDKFRTIYQKIHIKEDDLAALAGLSTSTVKNMFGGKTMRPQGLTYDKLAAAMHHEYVLVPMTNGSGEPNYEREIAQAKEERKSFHILQKRRRERAERRAAKK